MPPSPGLEQVIGNSISLTSRTINPADDDHLATSSPTPSISSIAASASKAKQPRQIGVDFTLDLRALTYASVVDENLMCPICRCPLVDPVTTECDHTFCRDCIMSSLNHKELCPIDRSPMSRRASVSRSPKIIINQLDNLKARCPSCDTTIPRSMLQHHLEKYCLETSVQCPGHVAESSCQEFVKRKYFDKGCLHQLTACPDCNGVILQIEMDDHRESACLERLACCESCSAEILRCKKSEHEETCPDLVVSCRWAEYGCQYEASRSKLHAHTSECTFKLVGPMAEMLKKEINQLHTSIRTLTETTQRQERRIKFLEKGSHGSEHLMDYSSLPGHSLQPFIDPGEADPLDSAHEYLLSLLEAQESKVGQLSTDMTEMNSKQTVMLFNETIPIKTELAEIRSNLQVTSMHVRWLMRFRMQDNQRRIGMPGTAPGLGPELSSSVENGGSRGEVQNPRRSVESMRELTTKL